MDRVERFIQILAFPSKCYNFYMESPIASPVLTCTQCGGELHPDEGQIFLTCPYCSATVYLDKSRVVFHWSLTPTLNETQARESLHRWMAGNQTVKDLDRKSRLVGMTFQYFPMWYFKRQAQGQEQIELQPAAATSVTELRKMRIPAGDLCRYEPALDSQSQPPTVPLETALSWLQAGSPDGVKVLESALVHIPVYTFKYIFNNKPYTAVVEAATGATLANIYPAKAESPYMLAGCLTAFVYFCLASIPIAGASLNNGDGLGISILIALGLGVIAAPALFALAAWVAAKV